MWLANWGSGEYPEWRWEDVEARGWEACVVLLLFLSLSLFSISLTCGFRLLTCLGSGYVCVCVCVSVCVSGS